MRDNKTQPKAENQTPHKGDNITWHDVSIIPKAQSTNQSISLVCSYEYSKNHQYLKVVQT